MTTVADFIKDALLLIQAVDARQPVSAVDMQTGIRALNRLCTRLEANSITLGWQDVTNPSDTLPMPPEAELAVMHGLAILLAPTYGVVPLPTVAASYQLHMNELSRDQAVATPIQPILDAPTPDNWRWSVKSNFLVG